MHAYIVMLDNQNTIPEWAADTTCRLVTGEADTKRRLYTDDEDVIIELRRAVILNGINVPTERGDVLDRSLVVELGRIPDAERKTEEQIWELFEQEHPRVLGALFDGLSKAIALKPSIELSRRPRLADWGEYAAAVYETMGWSAETFLDDWDEVVRAQNQATLDGSPVAQAIIKFMKDKEEYTATSSELHGKLKVVAAQLGVDVDRDKAWPKSARWLWRRIKEVLSLLVSAGIEANRDRDESAKQITLRKIPTGDGSDGSRGESRTDKGDPPADTDADDGMSDGRDTPNGRDDGSEKPPGNEASANTVDTANRCGDSTEETRTPEQTQRIRRLVKEGMSEKWARRTVLADGPPPSPADSKERAGGGDHLSGDDDHLRHTKANAPQNPAHLLEDDHGNQGDQDDHGDPLVHDRDHLGGGNGHDRMPREDANRGRALLENPPPWLSVQLVKYRKDPARFEKPTGAAVAAKVFGTPERWREVVPLIEEEAGVLRLIDEDASGRSRAGRTGRGVGG